MKEKSHSAEEVTLQEETFSSEERSTAGEISTSEDSGRELHLERKASTSARDYLFGHEEQRAL